jgi:hypothetical protein
VLSHRRVTADVGVRVRGIRDRDLEHDVQVQDSNARIDCCLSGVAKDIAAGTLR